MGSWGTNVRRLRRVEMEMLLREWLSIWMVPVSGRVMERRVDARVDFPEPWVVVSGGFLFLIEGGRSCACTRSFEATFFI